ncbi:MAG TPA: acyl-CoA dehydrogenase family protein [Acidimicrobiales bacterium]|nr:acyl-CoA dehydrogenase family protein [Acidimicrobiales bacterium]
MHFAFDERQLEFRAQLRALAEAQCPPGALRDAWDSEHGWSPERWRALGELGVTGLTVPETHGGLGLGYVDLVLLLEEVGRSGLPEPLLDTALAVSLLLGADDDADVEAVRRQWLPAVASGAAVLGVASPEYPRRVVAGTQLVVVHNDDGLYAVTAPEVSGPAVRSIDGARHHVEVVLDTARSTRLAQGRRATQLLNATYDRGALGVAAILVGAADRMIAMAAAYAKDRRQFGKAIGSFEAVKHQLADALVGNEFAKPLAYRAAWSVDEGDPRAGAHCSMAKAAAGDAASRAARVALQVHGAIGYTWEHDLHLWMKRAWSLASVWGDAGWHRQRIVGRVDW